MIAMSKEEMIRYLHDYAKTSSIIASKPNFTSFFSFKEHMLYNGREKEATEEYYKRMIRTYVNYCAMRVFSYDEDYTLNRDNYIAEQDLEDLKKDLLVFNSTGNISNKQMLKFIRNSFNHNDDQQFDRFKLSKNARNIEISLKDLRTPKEIEAGQEKRPLNLKFNIEYLSTLINNIIYNSSTIPYFVYKLSKFDISAKDLKKEIKDKVKLEGYLFPNKLTKVQKDNINKLLEYNPNIKDDDLVKNKTDLLNFIDSLGQKYEHKLSKVEIEKFYSLLKYNLEVRPDLVKEYQIPALSYYLQESVPIPQLKECTLYDQIFLAGSLRGNPSITHHNAVEIVKKAFCNKNIPVVSEWDRAISNKLKNMEKEKLFYLLNNMLSQEFLRSIPSVMYLDAVVTHYCQDEKITIDNISYDAEKIRNSLVHGRWIISKDRELVMYDADPKNEKSINLDYVGSIKIDSFMNWAEDYVDSKSNKNSIIFSSKK